MTNSTRRMEYIWDEELNINKLHSIASKCEKISKLKNWTKIWCEKKKQNVLILALNRVKIFTYLALWQFPTSEESWHWDINNGSTGLKAYCDTSLIIDSRLKKYLNPFMDLKFQPLFNFRFPTFQTILDSSNLTVLKPPASLPKRVKNPWW